MISIVIPTRNSADTLGQVLSALIPAAINNLVREVVVADAGSTDETLEIVEDAGARLVTGGVAQGCAAAKGPWLLILEPNLRLAPEWEAAARDHLEHHAAKAGYFRFALDDHRTGARLAEVWAGLRGPKAGRGLLLPKRLYEEVGGDLGRLAPSLRPLAARAFSIGWS